MDEYLNQSAGIVQDKHFESGVVKIIKNGENQLTATEKKAAKGLSLESSASEDGLYDETTSYFKKIENKRRKLQKRSNYADCKFIPATSCTAEPVFIMVR